MNLDGEAKQRVRTLGHYAALCAGMSAATLSREIASAFLVCRPQSALHMPEGPQATLRVDVRLLNAAREGRFTEACPVWPLHRREESVYSFVSVGRTQNCDVWIPDESVSKLHALVKARSGSFDILDAGSRNHTFVASEKVPRRGEGEPRPLASGVDVRFGTIETVFFSAEDLHRLARETADSELP